MSLQAISFDLQITPGSIPPVLHMSQYDSGRQYTAYLKDEENTAFIPGAGATAKLKGFNAAGVPWEQAATVDGSTVVFTPSGAATDQFGIMPVTIEITVGSEKLTPLLMIFDIQRAGYTNEQAVRSPEFETALEAAVAAAIEEGGLGFSEDFKEALLACFAHVAWADEHGQDYYDALEEALYPGPAPVTLVSITADYEQDRPIYDTDDLDAIKVSDDLTVTANYSDGTSVVLDDDDYTISGTLTVGTSTITVSYGGKTTTFNVVVSAGQLLPTGYQQVEWIQSDGGQAILTGVSITANSDYLTYSTEAEVAIVELNSSTGVLIGSTSNPGYYVCVDSSGTWIGMGSSYKFTDLDISDRNTFTLSWTADGSTAVCGAETITRTRTAQNTGQFAFFSDYEKLYGAKCRMFRANVKQNGSLIRDLIPCYRKSDSVIGMYDIVNDTFYTNSGTGTFTKGSDV